MKNAIDYINYKLEYKCSPNVVPSKTFLYLNNASCFVQLSPRLNNASCFYVYFVPNVVFCVLLSWICRSVFYHSRFVVPCFTIPDYLSRIPDILFCVPYIVIPAFRVLPQPIKQRDIQES